MEKKYQVEEKVWSSGVVTQYSSGKSRRFRGRYHFYLQDGRLSRTKDLQKQGIG
jgi:hypothetical protein